MIEDSSRAGDVEDTMERLVSGCSVMICVLFRSDYEDWERRPEPRVESQMAPMRQAVMTELKLAERFHKPTYFLFQDGFQSDPRRERFIQDYIWNTQHTRPFGSSHLPELEVLKLMDDLCDRALYQMIKTLFQEQQTKRTDTLAQTQTKYAERSASFEDPR